MTFFSYKGVRHRNFLHLLITINKGFLSFQKLYYIDYKFEFLQSLLILLFLSSIGLNPTYLNLRNIVISIINVHLANLMDAVILMDYGISLDQCM